MYMAISTTFCIFFGKNLVTMSIPMSCPLLHAMSAPRNDVHARKNIAKSMFHDIDIFKKRNIAEENTRIIRNTKPAPHTAVSIRQHHSYIFFITTSKTQNGSPLSDTGKREPEKHLARLSGMTAGRYLSSLKSLSFSPAENPRSLFVYRGSIAFWNSAISTSVIVTPFFLMLS